MWLEGVDVGCEGQRVFETRPEHSAEAVGNTGVVVVSSASLIWFLETACSDVMAHCCAAGEVSVGVDFNMRHIAPSRIGQPVEALARVTAVHGNKVDFEVTAFTGERVLMTGTHGRAIVDLRAFLDVPDP